MSSEKKNVSTKSTEKSDEILPCIKEENMASSCSTNVETNTATSSNNKMSLEKDITPKIEDTPIKIENSISEKNDSSKTKITPIITPTETTTSAEASIKTEKTAPKECNDEIIPSVDDEPMPDVCDCLIEDCPGCFFPCPTCTSNKCGLHCRTNRDFKTYDVWIDEGRNEVYSACSEEMRQKHEALIKEEKQKKLKKNKKKKHDVLVKMEAMENFLKKKDDDDLKRMEHGDDILKTTETKDNVLETVKQRVNVLEIAERGDDGLETVKQRNDILDEVEQGDIFRTMSKKN